MICAPSDSTTSCGDGLDRSGRADRHKHRRFHGLMRQVELRAPAALLGGMDQVELEAHQTILSGGVCIYRAGPSFRFTPARATRRIPSVVVGVLATSIVAVEQVLAGGEEFQVASRSRASRTHRAGR